MATEQQHAWNDAPDRRPLHYRRPRLTSTQRDEIRRRLADGERAIDLAAEYGVSRGAINSHR